ncbi:hypothetical protein FAUST_6916 [Fusarium austroamericanum]|uniref:NACHT domain-containing protein n=1 Tax=Fusarium austroamericanum TaxID=282268 RepID=A0AAN5Z7G9_FUSAU|nr:hypothetical protein FAUST_6916 [Fusarium austroamericanum]
MSGFEALGMACTVFQTISFAHETTRFCKDIYRGQKTPDSILEENASAMIQAADRTKAFCMAATTPEEKCLIDVAKECTSAAAELLDEVRKITELHKKGKGNIISAARGGVTSFWKKNKMNSLDNSLRRHTETMQTLLITRICDQNEAGLLKQRQDFDNLDWSLKVFISRIAEGYRKMEHLLQDEGKITREHVTNEATRTVDSVNAHITTQAENWEMRKAISSQRQRFLGSFRFQEMKERMNAITDPEDACFDRILESFEKTAHGKIESSSDTTEQQTSSEEIDKLWCSFADWLQSEGQLFWIQGKPGSGKSTLVKYVVSTEVTQTLLKQWNPNTRILSHFFWKIGTSLQNDIKGLYCSLLHQLLEGKDELSSCTMDSFPISKSKESYHDWSVQELNGILLRALKLATDHENLCIFIDGLDEFVGDSGQDAIIKILSDFKRFTKVKVCVTSRPELWLKEELDMAPNLKLHDLTAPDMRKWIHGRLQQFETKFTFSPDLSSDLVEQLLEKAGGVFLWIRLATQSVIRGIKNKDSEEMLMSRLEQLPEKLEDLYYDMWKRLGEDEPLYRKSAATYMHFMVGFRSMKDDKVINRCAGFRLPNSLTVIRMACACRPDIRKVLTTATEDIDYEMLNVLCETTKNQILTNCSGLLEIYRSTPYFRTPDHPLSKIGDRIDFVHRTAYDFLIGTEAGRKILSYSEMSDCEMEVLMVYGVLGVLRILHLGFDARRESTAVTRLLPRLLTLQRSDGDRQKVMDLWSTIKSFYANGILACGFRRWPPPPIASIVATIRPIFELEVKDLDPNEATGVLQGMPWHEIQWDNRSAIPSSEVQALLSQGADPTAAVSYISMYYSDTQIGKRTTALWEFLHHTQWAMWEAGSEKRATPPQVMEIAVQMLRKCPRIDQHGMLLRKEVLYLWGKSKYSYSSRDICKKAGFSANVAYLLDLMLWYLPQQDKAELKDQVQFIRSKIEDPKISLRTVVLRNDEKVLQRFQIIDQQLFQGLVELMDLRERNLEHVGDLGQWYDKALSLRKDATSMVKIEYEYDPGVLDIEDLLGRFKIEDGGLEYSHDLNREEQEARNSYESYGHIL